MNIALADGTNFPTDRNPVRGANNEHKALLSELPDTIEGGRLEKVGITNDGYVAYATRELPDYGRNVVYYSTTVRHGRDVELVNPRGDKANSHKKTLREYKEPDPRFGTKWYVPPW